MTTFEALTIAGGSATLALMFVGVVIKIVELRSRR